MRSSSPVPQAGKDGRYDWDDARYLISKIADCTREYAGLPTPIEGLSLIVEPTHRASKLYFELGQRKRPVVRREAVNAFFSTKLHSDIHVWKAEGWTKEKPKIEWGVDPGVHHAAFDLSTMGCSIAWSTEAEVKAMEKLRSLVPAHIFDMYFLTGMFLETSKRSGVTYVFRRLKPTIAIKGDKEDRMRILCCLCMHPIGYYEGSWAGSLVPTDDVLSHLLLMRADEPFYWRKSNQISPLRPNAGL